MTNTVHFRINQFSNFDPNIFVDEIKKVKGTILKSTIAICEKCHYHVPAFTYHADNQLWLAKHCKTHKFSHHMIERDYEFYSQLTYIHNEPQIYNHLQIITEVTDRCNLECPHCYHIPNNEIKDVSIDSLINKYKSWNLPFTLLVLAGAEPTIRKDFPELIQEIKQSLNNSMVTAISNGVRLSDPVLVQNLIDAKMDSMCFGLNHPSYINNVTVRNKQEQAIENCFNLGLKVETIAYTMSSINELYYILDEITTRNWPARFFRIRYGSDIGRYPDQPKMYVSDSYKLIKQWCKDNGKEFRDIPGDDTLYHKMISIDDKIIRIIQWGDESDLNIGELGCGPYADFSSDGIINFLHSVVRRDIEKNKGMILPDTVPKEYIFKWSSM